MHLLQDAFMVVYFWVQCRHCKIDMSNKVNRDAEPLWPLRTASKNDDEYEQQYQNEYENANAASGHRI